MKIVMPIFILFFSLLSIANEPSTIATGIPTEPNEVVKEKVEDIKGTIVKPTTEQTAAVSKAVTRAKKLKKKKK